MIAGVMRHSILLISFVGHVLLFCVAVLSVPSFDQLHPDAVREISVDLVDISEIIIQKPVVPRSAERRQIPQRAIKEKKPVSSEMTVPTPLLHMPKHVAHAASEQKHVGANLNVDKVSALLDKTPSPLLRNETAPSEQKHVDANLNVDKVSALLDKTPSSLLRNETDPSEQKHVDANLNVDKISALLDKTPDHDTLLVRDMFDQPVEDETSLDMQMTSDEIASLRSQIGRCWNPPIGLRGAADLSVRLRMHLSPDGTLSAPPQFMSEGEGSAFQAAIDSARRAVLRCQPYRLPPEKYVIWRDISVNFDPQLMFNE